MSARRTNKRRRKRVVGGAGEIRIGGRGARDKRGRFLAATGKNTKRVTDRHGQSVLVTYGKLFTAQQAARANRLNEELYGPSTYVANYPPHPFMRPAFDTELAQHMPQMWADSVKP